MNRNNWQIRFPLVDKNNYLGVQVVQGCSQLPLGIMSFLFLKLSEYMLGQHVSEFFSHSARQDG